MAGGIGSRFWPLSTEQNPKQFLDILGTGKSLIQMTFDRFKHMVPEENIYILTNQDYKLKVIEQLNVGGDQVLCEPLRKNTAPCLAYATAKIHKINSEAVILVSPSDHIIFNEKQFYDDLQVGINQAKNTDDLVTYGIKPNRPDTGYGYIEFDPNNKSNGQITKVKQFREKPSLNVAQEFLNKGNFYWNSGMFAWKSSTIINSFEKHSKNLYELFLANDTHYNTNEEAEFLKKAFSICEDISIDYAILEKESNISLILSSFDWSDLGTWGSLKDMVEKDKNGNSKNSKDVYFFNSNNCLIKSDPGKTVLIEGLDDYIVIDTKDKLMVLNAQNEQELKKYLKQMDKNNIPE